VLAGAFVTLADVLIAIRTLRAPRPAAVKNAAPTKAPAPTAVLAAPEAHRLPVTVPALPEAPVPSR